MGRWIWVVLLIGCAEPATSTPDASFSPTFETVIVTLRLTDVAREDSDGYVRGVDLDGRVSDSTDELGCNQEDFTDPLRGNPGVDNQYYTLVASYETNGPVRPPDEPTTQERILAADITLPLELASVAGGLEVRLGDAEPRVVPVDDGHFQALTTGSLEDFTVALFPHALHDLAVDGLITPDGELSNVVVAGALDIEEILTTLETTAPDVDPDLIRATLEGVADLQPGDDGRCGRVSAVFTAAVEP